MSTPAEPRRCQGFGKPCGKPIGPRALRCKSCAAKWRAAQPSDQKRIEAAREAKAAKAKYPAEERFCLVCGESLGRVPGHRIKDGRGRFCGKHRYLWGRYKKLHRERKGKIVACPVSGCEAEPRYLEPGELLRVNFTGLCRRHRGLTEDALRDLETGRDTNVAHEQEMRTKLQRKGKVDPQTAAAATGPAGEPRMTPGNLHAALRRQRAGDPEKRRPPVKVEMVENHKGTLVPRVVSATREFGRWGQLRYGTTAVFGRLAVPRAAEKGTKVGRDEALTAPEIALGLKLKDAGWGYRRIAAKFNELRKPEDAVSHMAVKRALDRARP
jgi:hypothetical protein